MHCQFFTVKVYLIFRLVVTTADVYLGHAFYFQQFTFQTGCYAIGHCHVISVNLKVGTCLCGHTRVTTTENYLCFTEFRIGFQIFTHLITDCFQSDITIARIHQTDVERDNMRTVVLHRCPSIIGVSLTNGVVADFHDVFILRQPLVG